MINLAVKYRLVTGTTVRRIAPLVTLPAGTYDVDAVLGSPGAVSTATMQVRQTSNSAVLATLTSAAEPTQLAAQRFTLAAPTEVEVVAVNSSASVGCASVDSVRIRLAPLRQLANGVKVRLGDNVLIGATTINVASGTGARFPSPSGGTYFMVTLQNSDGSALEVCRCTARTGDNLTVTRAQEGTAAAAWSLSTTQVVLGITAGHMTEIMGAL